MELETSMLRAALHCAAVKDIRTYLCGVCVDLKDGRIYGTDGHVAFIGYAPKSDLCERYTMQAAFVKAITKGKAYTVAVEYVDGKITATLQDGSQMTCSELEGTFPDMHHVMPRKISGESAEYNPALLAQANEALMIAADFKPSGSKVMGSKLMTNGNGPGVMVGARDCAYVLVMPWRDAEPTDADREAAQVFFHP